MKVFITAGKYQGRIGDAVYRFFHRADGCDSMMPFKDAKPRWFVIPRFDNAGSPQIIDMSEEDFKPMDDLMPGSDTVTALIHPVNGVDNLFALEFFNSPEAANTWLDRKKKKWALRTFPMGIQAKTFKVKNLRDVQPKERQG